MSFSRVFDDNFFTAMGNKFIRLKAGFFIVEERIKTSKRGEKYVTLLNSEF